MIIPVEITVTESQKNSSKDFSTKQNTSPTEVATNLDFPKTDVNNKVNKNEYSSVRSSTFEEGVKLNTEHLQVNFVCVST